MDNAWRNKPMLAETVLLTGMSWLRFRGAAHSDARNDRH
jgi:hypothetical protein